MKNWINVSKGLTAVHFKQSGNTICFTEMNWWNSNHFWLRQQFSPPPLCPGCISSGWSMQASQHFGSIKVRRAVNSAQLYKQTCCLASVPFGVRRKSETTAALMVNIHTERADLNAWIPCLESKHFESVNQQLFTFGRGILANAFIIALSCDHCKKCYTSHLLI